MAITDKRFNLGINGSDHGFQYGAQYISGTDDTLYQFKFKNGFVSDVWTPIQFDCGNVPVEQNSDNTNGYSKAENFDSTKDFKKAILRIYFPCWSIETLDKNCHQYILKASTHINGLECILCRCLIDRNDALAAEDEFVIANEKFYDCITVEVPDAYYICYDNSMATFRDLFKWIQPSTDPNIDNSYTYSDLNDEGAMIHIELTPVNYSDNLWIPSEIYHPASNVAHLDPLGENNLRYEILIDPTQNNIKGQIKFNPEYTGPNALEDYIKDTYPEYYNKLDNTLFQFYITNKDGIYVKLDNDGIEPHPNVISENSLMTLDSNDSWSDFIDGLLAFSIAYIRDANDNTLIQLDSNEIPITPENFSILLGQQNINSLDMPTYNIVNKIENNVVNINRPEDYNAHVVTPVFIRTQQTSNISVHPKVIEYITIPLDAYKSSVKTFILKLEDALFTEYSRTNSGVVFRVVGSMLTQEAIDTTYYILNENNEYVTSGNCKYIV